MGHDRRQGTNICLTHTLEWHQQGAAKRQETWLLRNVAGRHTKQMLNQRLVIEVCVLLGGYRCDTLTGNTEPVKGRGEASEESTTITKTTTHILILTTLYLPTQL